MTVESKSKIFFEWGSWSPDTYWEITAVVKRLGDMRDWPVYWGVCWETCRSCGRVWPKPGVLSSFKCNECCRDAMPHLTRSYEVKG